MRDDTAALQARLDRGGLVVLAAGDHRCATLRLRSGTTLALAAGARLRFAVDDRRFAPRHLPSPYASIGDHETADFRHALLSGEGLANLTITGEGSIDCDRSSRGGPKPIALLGCRDVHIEGITIRDAPNYAVSFGDCERVVVERVRVEGGYADGIDADGSRAVTIVECDVTTDDDAICIKTSLLLGGRAIPARDIVVERCRVRSASNGVKIGTETVGDVERVRIRDVAIDGRPRESHARDGHEARRLGVDEGGGIAVITVDGGAVRDVIAERVHTREVAAPLFVRRGERLRGGFRRVAGELSGVVVRDLDGDTAGGDRIIDGLPVRDFSSAVLGLPGRPVGAVSLERVRLVVPGGRREGVARIGDDRAAAYPRPSLLGPSPAVGLHVRHAPLVSVRDLAVESRSPDARPIIGEEPVTTR